MARAHIIRMRFHADRFAGVLLGMAVGDALGLPREGLTRKRAARLFGDGSLGHRLVLGRGLMSDDTEHACMTAQALLRAPTDERRFARSLAWRLRGWLLAMPAAIGWGTLRAILRLWIGIAPSHSGVRSAGNGAAMRAPILGACLTDTAQLVAYVGASTALTHRDPRAASGALVVALAAHAAVTASLDSFDARRCLDDLRTAATADGELRAALDLAATHLHAGSTPLEFATALGQGEGVSGYVHHTVPVALYAWLRYPSSFRAAVESTILIGGDTDTTGAIVGGLAGALHGEGGIPADWLAGITDWPRSTTWLRRLAGRLAAAFAPMAEDEPTRQTGPLSLFWPALPVRNAVFTLLVLVSGLRRLLPPY